MLESLNLASAGINSCNSCSVAALLGHAIRYRTRGPRRGIGSGKGDGVVAFVCRETVRIKYGIANARGAGIGVAVLENDRSPFYRGRGKAGAGCQKPSARGLRRILEIGAERDHLRRPRIIGQVSEAR